MAFLDGMYATAGALGLQVIAVEGTGLDRERVEHVMGRYRRFHGMPSYIIAVDPKRLLSEQFGVGGALPRTFIIGRGGTIVYYTDDFVSEGKSTMVRRIEEILGIEGGTLQKGIDSAGVAGPPSAAGAQVDTKGATGEEELFGACLLEAETLFRNFQYTAALPLYRRCLEIDGKSVSVRERLANIYQRQGKYGLALEQWNEVLLLEPGNEEAASQAERLRSLAGSTPVEQP
jgi:tetratricopeptide (TPR) repeat protein